ncbi:MAG: molybdenum cofactor guanylyltransferase [Candidatus Thorarchaeota archaeon]
MSSKNKSLTFAILIGGKSTRFGSDKGLFKFRGKALIDIILETLSPLNYDIFLIANSTQQVQNYIDKIDFKKIMGFIIDDHSFFQDQEARLPLIGLYSAFKELKSLEYEKAFVLPCDIPLIKCEVIDFLITGCNTFDCCIPKWEGSYLEPLFAIYNVNKAYETSLTNLRQKEYKLTKIINQDWNTNFISIEKDIIKLDPNLLSFKNINKLEDIKVLEMNLNKKQ